MAYIRARDRIGTTINGFYIEDVKREDKRTHAYVICPYCKNKKWMRMESVISGVCKSCGCYNAEHNLKKAKNLSGFIFDRLKAIRPTSQRDKNNGSVIWECHCNCGNITYVSESDLTRKAVKSCGCLAAEVHSKNGKNVGKNVVENFCIEGTNIKNLNAKIPKNNTSGTKGVYWDKSRKKWVAQIEFKGKHYYLGRYSKKEEAISIRKLAEEKLFGNFLEWFAEEFPERWKKINKGKI